MSEIERASERATNRFNVAEVWLADYEKSFNAIAFYLDIAGKRLRVRREEKGYFKLTCT